MKVKIKIPTAKQQALCAKCPFLSKDCFPEGKGVDCWGTHDIPAFFSRTGFKPLPVSEQTREVEAEIKKAKLGVIETAWRGYASYNLPPVCGRTQYEETRKAFFGGFSAFYTFLLPLTSDGEPEFDEKQFIERIGKISEEIADFIGALDESNDADKP